MSNKYVMLDLDDPRISNLADVISNKTSKKILDRLSDREMSANDIAEDLKIPLNTVTYNLEKLTESGLIERTKNFLWSSKGKKVPFYKLSNKKIIISPKSNIKGVIPAVLISGLAAIGIKAYLSSSVIADNYSTSLIEPAYAVASSESAKMMASDSSIASNSGITNLVSNIPHEWAWFLMGALFALIIFLIWNWRSYFSRN